MKKDRSKQKIIDAAISCLKECPMDKMSMRKIAEKAGVTTGSIYHHFKNKDEIKLAIMDHSLHFTKDLYDEIQSAKDLSGEALIKRINKGVANRLMKKDEQVLYILFLSEILKSTDSIKEQYQQHYIGLLDAVTNLTALSYECSLEKARPIATILLAAVDGIAMFQTMDVEGDNFEYFVDQFILFFNEAIPIFLQKKARGI